MAPNLILRNRTPSLLQGLKVGGPCHGALDAQVLTYLVRQSRLIDANRIDRRDIIGGTTPILGFLLLPAHFIQSTWYDTS